MNTYVEIPAGTTGTIINNGGTFQFSEDEVTQVVEIHETTVEILGGGIFVPRAAVRII